LVRWANLSAFDRRAVNPVDGLTSERRWVAWRNEPRRVGLTKVPYAPNGRRAKANDPATWGTRSEAETRAIKLVNGHGGGIGIELGDLGADIFLAGLDLDSCLSGEGAVAPWADAVLKEAPTYTEISPSGSGLKLFFYVARDDVRPFLDRIGIAPGRWGVRRDVPGEDARDHGPAIEVYCSGRFFAVTQREWPASPNRLMTLDAAQLEQLAALIPPAKANRSSTGTGADNSRSGIAFRKGLKLFTEGKSFDEMCAALRADPDTAEWCREKGNAHDGRELRRIWAKARENPTAGSNPQDHQQLFIGSDVEIAKGVAHDLLGEFGKVLFADGNFWRYNGTHWQPIDDPAARQAVHRYDGASYRTPNNQPSAVKLSKGRIDSVLHEMGAMLSRPDFFVDAPIGINCASGFIAFDSRGQPQLLPHDRSHRCRHVLPGHWQPGVSVEDPPRESLLGRLLGGVFKGDDDANDKRKFLAEIAGGSALGIATKLRQPKAIVLEGKRAENGKSQVLDLIRGLLPASANASVPAAKIGDERFIVGLRSKLLNTADEVSSAAIASDTFKAVVTGELVSGRDVYRSAITFRPVAQHIFATNILPTFAGGMDRGVQRRLAVITFNRVIPVEEQVEHIGIRVGEEESDLLLAWAVAGAARLIRQKGFTIPKSSKLALRDWLFGADSVLAWTEARVRPRDPEQGEYKSAFAHAQFKQWAIANGFREGTLPAVNGFVQRVQANIPNAAVKHTKSGNWLRGIEILAEDQQDDDETTG
jgi:phage/plasmid-associated DNA primase